MNKTKELIIIGVGETAKLAYEYFYYDSGYKPIAFAADKAFLPEEKTLYDLPIYDIAEIESYFSPDKYDAFVAVSSNHMNRDRAGLYEQMKTKGYYLASYVSSEASVWKNAEIGENCFILSHAILQPFSQVGNDVYLWVKSNIGHRSIVKEHAFIASADIAGFSEVGKYCFLGAGSIIADYKKIADNNFIGMGAVVNRNTKPDSIYVGNPAKRLPVSVDEFFQIDKGK